MGLFLNCPPKWRAHLHHKFYRALLSLWNIILLSLTRISRLEFRNVSPQEQRVTALEPSRMSAHFDHDLEQQSLRDRPTWEISHPLRSDHTVRAMSKWYGFVVHNPRFTSIDTQLTFDNVVSAVSFVVTLVADNKICSLSSWNTESKYNSGFLIKQIPRTPPIESLADEHNTRVNETEPINDFNTSLQLKKLFRLCLSTFWRSSPFRGAGPTCSGAVSISRGRW